MYVLHPKLQGIRRALWRNQPGVQSYLLKDSETSLGLDDPAPHKGRRELVYRDPYPFVKELHVNVDLVTPMTIFALFATVMAVIFALRVSLLQITYKDCRFELSIRARRLLLGPTDNASVRVTGNLDFVFDLLIKDLVAGMEGSLRWAPGGHVWRSTERLNWPHVDSEDV